MVKYSKEGIKDSKLHEALITIAEKDIDLLSYEGQTLWNKLASKSGKKMRKVI
jgi:hypothetical protein